MVGDIKTRYLLSSFITAVRQFGVFIASYVYHLSLDDDKKKILFSILPHNYDEFYIDEYGDIILYKIAFFIGGFLGFIIFLFRKFYFKDLSQLNDRNILRNNIDKDDINFKRNDRIVSISSEKYKFREQFITSLILRGICGGIYNFYIIFLANFLHLALNVPLENTSSSNSNLILLYIIMSIFCGIISVFFKRSNISKYLLNISLLISILFLFIAIYSPTFKVIYIMHLVSVCMMGIYSIMIPINIQYIFPKSLRARMCSTSHAVGSLIFSSSTAFICSIIWYYTESLSILLGYIFLGKVSLLFINYYIMPKYKVFET
ncbi:MAG TPA: hypothetical protein QKA14_02585 [Candidatus Megaira endosymbiont of Hartmannula sinica]|nr:hypothetical protein [Candidatus Megaera endosymbiont of Hartmannula sinica]